jgi:hypothetical protein
LDYGEAEYLDGGEAGSADYFVLFGVLFADYHLNLVFAVFELHAFLGGLETVVAH